MWINNVDNNRVFALIHYIHSYTDYKWYMNYKLWITEEAKSMKANEIKPEIIIELDKSRQVKYTLSSICKLENEYGSLEKAFDLVSQSPKITDILKLLYYGLIWEDKALSLEQLGDMLDIRDINEVTDVITQALNVSQPVITTVEASHQDHKTKN